MKFQNQITDFLFKFFLNIGMNIFTRVISLKSFILNALKNFTQPFFKFVKFVFCQKPRIFQDPDVETRSQNIPEGKLEIKLNRFRKLLNQRIDRKSTRLNSSHSSISYAVFCLKQS